MNTLMRSTDGRASRKMHVLQALLYVTYVYIYIYILYKHSTMYSHGGVYKHVHLQWLHENNAFLVTTRSTHVDSKGSTFILGAEPMYIWGGRVLVLENMVSTSIQIAINAHTYFHHQDAFYCQVMRVCGEVVFLCIWGSVTCWESDSYQKGG